MDSARQICESDSIVRYSWWHAEFSYFLNEAVASVAAGLTDNQEDGDDAVDADSNDNRADYSDGDADDTTDNDK